MFIHSLSVMKNDKKSRHTQNTIDLYTCIYVYEYPINIDDTSF